MNQIELILQGFNLELAKMTIALNELKDEIKTKTKYEDLPEWINLNQAVKLKGGCALQCVRNQLFLQPCCGLNYKYIGGRKCWKREDVIAWIGMNDSDLKEYGKEWKVSIPKTYEKRAV
jgi:hypothetical protein